MNDDDGDGGPGRDFVDASDHCYLVLEIHPWEAANPHQRQSRTSDWTLRLIYWNWTTVSHTLTVCRRRNCTWTRNYCYCCYYYVLS